MKLDLAKASRKLSELDLKITSDNLLIDILWFRVMENEGDWVINRHMHSTYEFHFIFSGCCKVIHDDGEFEISAGEFYLTAPGVYHEQRSISSEKLIEYSINCDLKLAEDEPSEAQHVLKVLKETPCKQFKDSLGVMKLFHNALGEAYHQNIGFYSNIRSLVIMIITNAARIIDGNSPVKYNIPLKNRKDDYRFIQIKKFIEDNYCNPITTSDIAGYMYLSSKQVCRIVKEKKGISTKDLIMQVKLRRAKELLKETDLSITQISDKLGFSSEYYFNCFFKREEGYPPGIYRHNVQNV